MVWRDLGSDHPWDWTPANAVKYRVEVYSDDGNILENDGGIWATCIRRGVKCSVNADPKHHYTLAKASDNKAFFAADAFNGNDER